MGEAQWMRGRRKRSSVDRGTMPTASGPARGSGADTRAAHNTRATRIPSATPPVLPLCRRAVLGQLVHRARLDLHLHGDAARPPDCRVKRLVAARLWIGDVVVKLAWYALPEAVHRRHERVARLDSVVHAHATRIVDDDAQRARIVHLQGVGTGHRGGKCGGTRRRRAHSCRTRRQR
eukprot:296072-Chlamydomonas_euryale.AAC.1